jgi:hypothetical protein
MRILKNFFIFRFPVSGLLPPVYKIKHPASGIGEEDKTKNTPNRKGHRNG